MLFQRLRQPRHAGHYFASQNMRWPEDTLMQAGCRCRPIARFTAFMAFARCAAMPERFRYLPDASHAAAFAPAFRYCHSRGFLRRMASQRIAVFAERQPPARLRRRRLFQPRPPISPTPVDSCHAATTTDVSRH